MSTSKNSAQQDLQDRSRREALACAERRLAALSSTIANLLSVPGDNSNASRAAIRMIAEQLCDETALLITALARDPAGQPQDERSDACLVALGKQIAANQLDIRSAADGPQIERKVRDGVEIATRIEGLTASSISGLKAKARAVLWCREGDWTPEHGDTLDVRIALAIVRDLLAMRDPLIPVCERG